MKILKCHNGSGYHAWTKPFWQIINTPSQVIVPIAQASNEQVKIKAVAHIRCTHCNLQRIINYEGKILTEVKPFSRYGK